MTQKSIKGAPNSRLALSKCLHCCNHCLTCKLTCIKFWIVMIETVFSLIFLTGGLWGFTLCLSIGFSWGTASHWILRSRSLSNPTVSVSLNQLLSGCLGFKLRSQCMHSKHSFPPSHHPSPHWRVFIIPHFTSNLFSHEKSISTVVWTLTTQRRLYYSKWGLCTHVFWCNGAGRT